LVKSGFGEWIGTDQLSRKRWPTDPTIFGMWQAAKGEGLIWKGVFEGRFSTAGTTIFKFGRKDVTLAILTNSSRLQFIHMMRFLQF
jgi:hypothetical protein